MAGRRVLFSAQKNEGPFILEWVAFHKVVGFTEIVVVSNDCDDGSDDLLDALAAAGEVVHLRQTVPPGAAPQKNAEAVARSAGCFRPGDWVMWLDLDEYLLVSHGERRLDDLLARTEDKDAISVAWRFFGDGGNEKWPGRQISPAFTGAERRNRSKRPQVKTLFRFDERIERLDIHRPVLAEGVGPDAFRWISSSGRPVDPAFFDRRRARPFNRITDGSTFYRLAQVMHFSIRTPDMFARKSRRGDGYYAAATNPVSRDERFYRRKNFNDVEERAGLSLLPRIDAELARLAALPGCDGPRKRRDCSPKPRLPVHYWRGKRNFGDLLGPMICTKLSGRPTEPATADMAGRYLVSVGSILQTIDRPGAVVWGSGLLRPLSPAWRTRLSKNRPDRVAALRGRLTAAEVQSGLGWDAPDALGDPALLLSRIFPEFGDGSGSHVALCPHLSHRALFDRPLPRDVRFLDVADPPESVVRAIATARACIATSLHGLIVAQSYGVPWLWLRIDDAIPDRSDFKFRDFFSTLDADAVAVRNWSGDEPLALLADMVDVCSVPALRTDLDALHDSFPARFLTPGESPESVTASIPALRS